MSTPVSATRAWFGTLEDLFLEGWPVSPRGQDTLELPQHTVAVDMRHPVVVAPSRKLSEKFMAAEAHWMLSGDDRTETIAPYNRNISQFSDDGLTFFGAYGPRILDQLEYVVGKLVQDPDTRQAGLTTWRQNPPSQTKDVPCTISMFFSIRKGRLNNHVFMRSNDIWLGFPYDVFNFSMVAMLVLARLNTFRAQQPIGPVRPGVLYLTAGSRHLYDRNSDAALKVMHDEPWDPVTGEVPRELWLSERKLMKTLEAIREGETAAKWWRQP